MRIKVVLILFMYLVISFSANSVSAQTKSVETEDTIPHYSIEQIKKESTFQPNVKLPEVVILSTNKKKPYLHLHCYFRTYEYDEGYPMNLTTGIIDYYIKKNGHISYRVDNCEVYQNLRADSLVFKTKMKISISMDDGGVPQILGLGFIPGIKTHFTFDEDGDSVTILRKKHKKGIITFNDNRFTANVDFLGPKKEIKRSFLGLHMILYEAKATEEFQGHFSIPLYGKLLIYRSYFDAAVKIFRSRYYRRQAIEEVYVISQSRCDKKARPKTSTKFNRSNKHSFGQMSKDDLEFVSKLPQLPQPIQENMNTLLIKQ